MAKSQSTLKPAVKETAIPAFLADRVSAIAEHLQDLSDLLYENQDRFASDPIILGAEIF
jgi:hypothetical protein